jgi:hypothetical protein
MTEAATAPSAETEEISSEDFLADYSAPAVNAPKDLVAGRYRILLAQPLPEFNKKLALAYAVEDIEGKNTDAYALICDNTMPYRMKGIEALSEAVPPVLPACYAAAPTPLSAPAETRMVMVVQKPTGQKLSSLIAANGPLSDRFIIDKILKPLIDGLLFLEKYKINHGCINPDTLYFGTELKIDEPISEPSGYSQNYFYEPPERLIADASGKGSGSTATDAYAIAVLALYLSLGKLPIQQLTKLQLEDRLLKMGCYHAFAHNIDPSPALFDLLRGALSDNVNERWGCEQMSAWLNGKRFNLILPSIPTDSSRSFSFGDLEFSNYRALAQSLYRQWDNVKTQLSAAKMVKWMELNASKADAADAISNLLYNFSEHADSTPALTDQEVMKVIAILDPEGPMRYKEASVNIDGLGKAFAECFRDKNNLRRQHLIAMIESGLPALLSDHIEATGNSLATNALWRLQKLRNVLQLKGLGYGVERILYSLNPSLPCQSPLVLKHHPITLMDTLTVIDRIAKEAMKKSSLIDVHLAAFLTCKMEITKELRVLELAGHPDLFIDQRLITLKLLAMAQQKAGNPPLKGLAFWALEMVTPIVQKIHHKSNRETLTKELTKAAKTGILEKIAFLLFKETIYSQDRIEYDRAKLLYAHYQNMIAGHKDSTRLKKLAILNGRSMSVTIGFLALIFGTYLALDPYVRL